MKKKMIKKEVLIDYSLSCFCNASVMEFSTNSINGMLHELKM